jgi:hypothetical protein
MAASMKKTVFWDVAPFSVIEIDRRFRSDYCLHRQDRLSLKDVYKTTFQKLSDTDFILDVFRWHFFRITHKYRVYSGVLIMGVSLTCHWTAAAFTGLLFVPRRINEWMDEWKNFLFNFRKCGAHGGMIQTGENRRTRRETCPSATLSTTNPTGLTRAWTRASAMKGRRLTAWEGHASCLDRRMFKLFLSYFDLKQWRASVRLLEIKMFSVIKHFMTRLIVNSTNYIIMCLSTVTSV